MTFSNVTYNSFTVSFIAPTSTPVGYLVLRNSGSAVVGAPEGGTVYTLGQTNIGTSGTNEVVYVGTSAWNAYSQASLTDNTAYHYAVYSYNGSGVTTNYSTALIGNQTTAAIPATTAIPATDISTNGFTANWSEGTAAIAYRLDVSTKSNFSISTTNPGQTIVSNSGSTGAVGWAETDILLLLSLSCALFFTC